jgi:hypothetical protein
MTALWSGLTEKPKKETNYNHLIANFSGLLMVCLIHPSHEKTITGYNPNTSGTDPVLFTTFLEKSTDINYLTIPIRPGHVMYIPYGWYYYIYCGQENTACVYMDLMNKTWFG